MTAALGPPVLDIAAAADKSVYSPGEKINVQISATNISKEDLMIDNFPPQTEIHSGIYLEIYSSYSGVVRTLSQGNESKSLKPGETLIYQI